MITHHTALLNALIEKYNLKSYLEIGVQNPANNFDLIKCEVKHGIDPDIKNDSRIFDGTSDEFFKYWHGERTWHLVFIDGFHTKEQAKKDFENSLRCLNDNGFILIHDVLPENEAGTKVPRETKQWWGDVYKWAMRMSEYSGVNFKTFNIDNGCMLIWKDKTIIGRPMISEMNWKTYLHSGHDFMNVTNEVNI